MAYATLRLDVPKRYNAASKVFSIGCSIFCPFCSVIYTGRWLLNRKSSCFSVSFRCNLVRSYPMTSQKSLMENQQSPNRSFICEDAT